jgi:hypothetical protein
VTQENSVEKVGEISRPEIQGVQPDLICYHQGNEPPYFLEKQHGPPG